MFEKPKNETCKPEDFARPENDKSLQVQLVLSLAIGVVAFITFCLLRPRWPELYAARKRRLEPEVGPPKLPNSTFGWIPKLYRVTEEQILASAGLDAFVFLSFFKMSTQLFAIMAFFATAVLWPINAHFRNFRLDLGGHAMGEDTSTAFNKSQYGPGQVYLPGADIDVFRPKGGRDKSSELRYLWSYVTFTYLFVALTIYFINWETFRIIRYRQEYLGSQSTITDRTFRLTGIPPDLRSEGRIKRLIERLNIGHVDTVTICRDWQQLDGLVDMRDMTLRNLEAAWAKYVKHQEHVAKQNGTQTHTRDYLTRNHRQGESNDEEAGENGHLLEDDQVQPDTEEGRPRVSVPYGFLGLRSRKVDAIDYYDEKLRRLDARIVLARKKNYKATDMALVTMDTVASCQLVIQARIDPRPGRLLTKPTPAPSDLVWRNTYSQRGIRRLKSWAVTLFITILTLVWTIPTATLASLLSICAIRTVAPGFSHWLEGHSIINSLVQNGVPTLVVSLLNVAVPYLYDWLSNCQGMISRGDVELSLISKNFFFIFFNTFFVFAVSKTGLDFFPVLREFLKDTSQIPVVIARDVEGLSIFYICFIMLQGIGLMPFRILEVGSVILYPVYRWLSKTPRDFAELKQPPIFQYGFYLPTALLVFNLCLIYSVLSLGFAILIVGTIYFGLGYFTFKYMVLYAMDQPQHATGGAWRIICYRIIIGLVVFEVVMVGQIASLLAFVQSVTILPLIPLTIWYSFYIQERFVPLTKYIALRAINLDDDDEDDSLAAGFSGPFEDEEPRPPLNVLRRGSTLDEYKEKGLAFVNPSLVTPLQRPWIYHDPPPDSDDETSQSAEERDPVVLAAADSTLGIGDSNVWRENADSNSPEWEAAAITSSQILLSRGVARARPTKSRGVRPQQPSKQLGREMATVALILDLGQRINAVPAGIGNVQRLIGNNYNVRQTINPPASMRLPTEIIQYICFYLHPVDYHAARRTCRSWFLASLNRSLLVHMLKRGGWWRSMLQILAPLNMARLFSLNQERILSKWLSRECTLADLKKSAFSEVGYTDFRKLVPGSTAGALHGALAFTVSLCGRFLMVAHGQLVHVYELNHVCSSPRSRWSIPLQPRTSMRLGMLRPVTTVICPRDVISCSMDTSAGRHALAVLMEGRMGMVCDIMAERIGASKTTSNSTSHEGSRTGTPSSMGRTPPACICQETPVCRPPPIEEGPRSVYRSICHPDDPPKSVALCPQRNCVAFGCSARIELHWVDALTGQDLNRWFPLTSSSDFLYFLPARRGVDTGKRLRLISSASVTVGNQLGRVGSIFQGFETATARRGSTACVSVMDTGASRQRTSYDIHSVDDLPSQRSCVRARDLIDKQLPNDGCLRRVSASNADHYRAVPVGDGYHILFTDPKTGNLCLGTDAPVSSSHRLVRKVWFRPPVGVSPTLPVLYTAGTDTRHGVRVVATFSINSGDGLGVDRRVEQDASAPGRGPLSSVGGEKQLIVFYSIAPDMFRDVSRAGSDAAQQPRGTADDDGGEDRSEWVRWRPEECYSAIKMTTDGFRASAAYPLEIRGQPVAICSNLVELALDSGPDMILWAFSAEGWARTWALHTGRTDAFTHTKIQLDGSLRHVDGDGDFVMAEVENLDTSDGSDMINLPLYDGPGSTSLQWQQPRVERYRRLMTGWEGGRTHGTVSVDLVEERSPGVGHLSQPNKAWTSDAGDAVAVSPRDPHRRRGGSFYEFSIPWPHPGPVRGLSVAAPERFSGQPPHREAHATWPPWKRTTEVEIRKPAASTHARRWRRNANAFQPLDCVSQPGTSPSNKPGPTAESGAPIQERRVIPIAANEREAARREKISAARFVPLPESQNRNPDPGPYRPHTHTLPPAPFGGRSVVRRFSQQPHVGPRTHLTWPLRCHLQPPYRRCTGVRVAATGASR
ncbi:hypothetical protein G7046_g7069 [Stylonectria norvegica]|nr:hypothetical protein G7046_g7069 [Stylonectria norvegica]